jgi:hypothetical protein
VSGAERQFGTLVKMSEPESEGTDLAVDATVSDALAARLLAAQRLLATLDAESEARARLNLRYAAICTSIKMPGANPARGLQRLDRLIAEARLAQVN